MFKRILAALTVSVAALSAGGADAAFDRKVALIVGNGAYENAPKLPNPVRDAKAVAAAFKRLGFETVTGYDLDRDGMNSTLRAFSRASRDADLTVFFYAGHGIGYEGRNFMVPVDAAFSDPTALDFEAVGVDFVTKQMRYADGVSLVFLDACRDNPLANTLSRSLGLSTRSTLSRGLAQMDVTGAGKGLAIAFATSPGEVAYDGAGNHSPFTAALLEHIETPDTDITEVMSRVTGDVLRATEERQRPWLNASLTGPVVLKPEPVAAPAVKVAALNTGTVSDAAPVPATAGDLQAQTLLYNLARETGARSDYEAYLTTFPNGLYAHNAKAAIATLGENKRAVRINQPLQTAAADPKTTASPLTFADTADTADTATTAAAKTEGQSVAGTAETEAALALTRPQRREVQHRLNLADASVGGADGLFGPMTRRGITGWQDKNGFAATGYLTAPQIAALNTATDEAYAALVERQKAAAAARAAERRAAKQRAASRKASATKTRSVAKKSTGKRTAKTTTRRKTARTTTRRSAPRREVVRDEPVVLSRQRVSSGGGFNPVAAAAAGMIVGGIVGGYIGR